MGGALGGGAVKGEMDPTIAFVFKRVYGRDVNLELGSTPLHAGIDPLPGRRVRELALRSPFREKEFTQDKLSVFDIRGRDQANRDFLLEMQRKAPWYFGKRALFYAATDYAKQLRGGEHYMTLQPVFVI